ncbi:MAG: DNA polymerase III subunit alpha [Planctomycetota bacterium]|jgi:DNA-directed DNA polymerase III PolC
MRIAALTCRSYYSLLRGPLSVRRLVDRAKGYGYGAIALADVNCMYGVADFCKCAEQADIKAIIGVEILSRTQRAVLLAETRAGYENLCKITTARNLDPNFCLIGQLNTHNKGLICICSDQTLLPALRNIFHKDNLFAGCRTTAQVEWAVANRIAPIACDNFNGLDDSDMTTAKLLSRIRHLSVAGSGPKDNNGFKKLVPHRQFKQRLRGCPQAIRNAEQLTERCNFQLLNGRYFLPKVKLSKARTADVELGRLCHIGLAKKYNPVGRDIVKRLERELAVIRENKFSDYFLVVHRIVRFAKEQGIPVEVRGSAAGALVSHLLGFTRVCPIANNLYFERFMNPGRKDCPDIDIDLCWRRRDEVIEFCYEYWGYRNVAMISNINRYRRRSAIRDVGRFLDLEPRQINELARSRKPNRNSAIYKLAETIIDVPRHLGVHCGGIVITPKPVSHIAPLERANKGVIITQYDKRAAEAVGLVKIDLLGNRALSTVKEAVNIITKSGTGVDIDSIDPKDKTTAKMLTAGDSLGVFQCESPGMRQLLQGLKVKSRKDAAIALSLIRPGPASGGMKTEFIQRHINRKPFRYLHPRIKDVLGDTYGVMLYQEDVMRIAVELAGYTLAEANQFRTEVSKKVSAVRLQRQYVDFVYSKAEQQGIDRQTAEAIWEQILKFAAYSYCKAHATVYANIAWQTAFLKAHYPQQFYTSLFNNHHGMYPLRTYVWQAMRAGMKILPPHVNHSEIEWTTEGKAIRAGLNIIKGLSYRAMETIVRQRRIAPFTDIHDLRTRVRLNRPQLQNLIHVGACDNLGKSRPAMLAQLHFRPLDPNQLLLFDPYNNPADKGLPEYDRLAKLKAEIDVTRVPFIMHPALLVQMEHTPAARLGKFVNRQVTIAGFKAAARRARTSDGRTMGFVTVEDASGLAEISFFPDKINLYRKIRSRGGAIWVKGKVSEHLSSITIEAADCGQVT